MQIEHRPLADLKDYDRNARTHDKKQVDKLVASIKEFGFNNPILIRDDGTIIAGHGRLAAARKMGLETVPCLKLSHLTPEQAKAYVIADNALAELAGWDNDMLKLELGDLQALDFDLDLLGLDNLEKLLAQMPGQEGQTDPDAVPDIPKKAKTKLGQIWALGSHRLMCGDSTEQKNADLLMNGALADMMFIDPPYGVDYTGKVFDSLVRAGRQSAKRKHHGIDNDALNDDQQAAFWLALFTNCAGALRPGAPYYVCSPQGGRMMMMMMMMQEAGLPQRHELIWKKSSLVLGRADYHYIHEPIMYGWKEGAGHFFCDDRTQTSVWDFPKPNNSDLHPTMKPVELVAKAIQNSTLLGNIVIDFTLGSGTTLIAAEKTGRICYGMELSEHYCDVIIKRWEDFTGRKAELVHA